VHAAKWVSEIGCLKAAPSHAGRIELRHGERHAGEVLG
jgi:hypothetical protein